jgi:hypothetical protein
MRNPARRLLIAAAATLTFAGTVATAVQPAASTDAGPAALATPDRQALVSEILGLWGSAPNPVNARNEALHPDLRAALKAATTEQLLDAQKARTLDELWGALPKSASSPAAVPLAAGRIPQVVLGLDTDLVYTPVTPCRIIDTRGGVAPYTGVIGPNAGNSFYVTGTTYANQGGFAGSCGIPTLPKPAAVAINITSTGQSGNGNLKAIQSGGGSPTVSLVNYVAGVNIANAAIVPSNQGAGEEIYIYSANSSSHAVVDILGYFSTPFAKQPDNEIMAASSLVAGSTDFAVYSPPCDPGYRLSGGGYLPESYGGATFIGARPVNGLSSAILSGANTGDRYLCQGTTASSSQTIYCWAVCMRIPGTVILF